MSFTFAVSVTKRLMVVVVRPLGPLNYMRVWHDNSGKGKYMSWYLNWIIIRDLQTGRRFYFIVNQWFAVEEEDGQVRKINLFLYSL